MKTPFRRFVSRTQEGSVAVEMAIVLPILIMLVTTLMFFARVFWFYGVAQKAAHDAARYLSTASVVEMRTVGTPVAPLAESIANAELAALDTMIEAKSIRVDCNLGACGFGVPNTVRVLVQLQMRDTIFGPITSAYYGEDGLLLTADVSMRYVGN